MPTAILFYDVVLFVHVAAIVVAFGVTFAYPVLGPFIAKNHLRSLPALHEGQTQVGKLVIMPAATVALIAGAYLATDRELWGEVWVTVPLAILIVLLGLGGAFFTPHERRAAELAERDIATSGAGEVVFSHEYQAAQKRVAGVGVLADVLILVALFFMIAKPFA